MRSRTLVVAVGVVAVLAVAGCNKSSGEMESPDKTAAEAGSSPAAASPPSAPAQAPQEVVQAAVLNTEQAGSTKVTFEVSVGSQTAMSGTGLYDFGPPLQADIDLTLLASSGQQTLGGARQILTGDAIYFRIPALTGGLAKAKPWIKVPLADLQKQTGIDIGALLQQIVQGAQQSNPEQPLRMLIASGDLRAVGEEPIDGVPTTHYSGTVDAREGMAQLSGEVGEATRQRLEQAEVKSITIDVWVDADQRVRQVVQSYGSAQGPVKTTVRVAEQDPSEAVTPPPADQVSDLGTRFGG